MATVTSDALANALVQHGGYNSTDAANAARGPRASELAREFGQYLGIAPSQNTASQGSSMNSGDIKRQIQQSVQPTIDALQGQANLIPQKTQQQQQSLERQQGSLQQRYDNLIADYKRLGDREVERSTVATGQALSNRGISSDSEYFSQEMAKALNPIDEATQSAIMQTGLAREDSLAQIGEALRYLPLQEQEQILAIQQAMGQIQGGASQNAISAALQLASQQQAANQVAQQLAMQRQAQDLQLSQAFQMFPLSLQQAQANLAQTQAQTKKLGSTGSSVTLPSLDTFFQ